MDLLERFVTLERTHEEVSCKYKSKTRECGVLSDKLSTVEFDLLLAEEQLQKSKRPMLDSLTPSSSSGKIPISIVQLFTGLP